MLLKHIQITFLMINGKSFNLPLQLQIAIQELFNAV